MISKQTQEKGILAKFLEQCMRILIIKECRKINKIKINIISSSTQIIRGKIQKLNIMAEDVNYKNLVFDEVELEANELKINFKFINKELYFKNNPIIKFKISISQKSLRTFLLSNNWNWIGNMISKEILNQEKLEDIKINNDELMIKSSKKNNSINEFEKIDIKAEKGKVYLENEKYNKTLKIPFEDKIYVENVSIENNIINFFGTSSISF